MSKIITKTNEYTLDKSLSIEDALRKINTTKHQVIFVVDSDQVLLGSFSDGDFRRYFLENGNLDSNISILSVMNKECVSLPQDSNHEEIVRTLNGRIKTVPLVDKMGKVVSVVELSSSSFDVGGLSISNESAAFIIAEIGNNHQGKLQIAKDLIDKAKEAGADCVKFQMRNMDSLYGKSHKEDSDSEDLGSQYTLNLLSKYQLSQKDLFAAFDYSYSQGIVPLCTPWDTESLVELEEYGMEAYKIASADFTNLILLNEVIKTGKPMFCSTGMCSEDEISATVKFLNEKGANFVLLHCNSTYPAPFKDINLNYLKTLQGYSDNVIGYSGHERGISIALAAVALGAKVIEKHFTLDKNQEGNDHKVSLLPEEFKTMVEHIRQVELALTPKALRTLSQGEMMNRQVLGKSIYVVDSMKAGEKLTLDKLGIKSPGTGIPPYKIESIVEKKLINDIKAGSILSEFHLSGLEGKKPMYNFTRPYGIPVRYHDYESLTKSTQLDFVEFHLSCDDLLLDPKVYINSKGSNNLGLAVHAPELFPKDHVLDLASFEEDYRHDSIGYLSKVVDSTSKLNLLFPLTQKPVLILNAGGWSENNFLDENSKKRKYKLIEEALNEFKEITNDINICIQTMPPFPWHLGGQRFHNLFVDPNEIKEFCKRTGHNICLDISHSMMACNYYGWSIDEFIKLVSKFTCHIHISDSEGDDGEGVQMGKGEVEFGSLINLLNKEVPGVQFIPEVWQGHHNDGQGFWSALEYLENEGF
jgi:N-acetylneuraminate synthase